MRQGPDDEPALPRVIVLRALGIGDLLASVPALRALRRAFAQHEIVLAAPRELAPLAELTESVDSLLPASAPGRAVPESLDWRGPPPTVAVDLHGNGPPSHRLLTSLAPRRTLAFAHPGTPAITGPPWCAHEHERDRWCRLLRSYGIAADPSDVRLSPPPQAPSPAPRAVVVHPGAEAASRRWPVERYADVVSTLHRSGHRIALTGSPRERPLLDELADATGLPRDAVHDGLGLERLAALVADASAVVSGDTGIAHLATAYGTPSVTLFGPVSPALWGPPPGGRHRALWHPGPPGDPHGPRPDALLLRITPAEVIAAFRELPVQEGVSVR